MRIGKASASDACRAENLPLERVGFFPENATTNVAKHDCRSSGYTKHAAFSRGMFTVQTTRGLGIAVLFCFVALNVDGDRRAGVIVLVAFSDLVSAVRDCCDCVG